MSLSVTMNPQRVAKGAVELLVAFGIFLGATTLAHCNQGCALFGADKIEPPSVNEVGYTTELAACVDHAKTLSESKACRREVDRRWGLCTKVDGVERCP